MSHVFDFKYGMCDRHTMGPWKWLDIVLLDRGVGGFAGRRMKHRPALVAFL